MEKNHILTCGDLQVFCTRTEPDFGTIRRVVLGVHGIGGSTQDEIQSGLAEEMELFSSAMVRFDFPGHGRSPMDGDAFTFDNCLASLMTAARFAREQYPEVEDLCVFATGFGAYITLTALDDLIALGGRVKLVVQTPSLLMHESILAMKGITAPTLEAMGSLTFQRLQRPVTVDYRFYLDMRQNPALNSYPIPMLILHGEEDSFIKMDTIRQLRRINEDAKLVIIPGATHRFLEPGAWDMVLDLTRDWFEYEQVLCCDWE